MKHENLNEPIRMFEDKQRPITTKEFGTSACALARQFETAKRKQINRSGSNNTIFFGSDLSSLAVNLLFLDPNLFTT